MVYQQIIRKWDLLSEEQFGLFDKAGLDFGPEWIKEENERIKSFKQFPQFDLKISDSMKQQARYGIPQKKRRRWWLVASGGLKLLTQIGDVWQAAKRSADSIIPSENSKFGCAIDILTFLPPAISQKVNKFLHVLWSQNQEIDFSPLIPTISALLLLYMEVPLAYISIQSMINKSRQDSWYFTLTKDQFLASVHAFDQLVEKRCQSVSHHAKSLNLNIAQIGLSLFPVFFLPFMPLPIALTLFDSFIIEGRKVLYRFCLNLLIQEKKNLLNCKEAQSFVTVIINAMERLQHISSFKSFMKNSFKIFLSRSKHIDEIEAHAIASRSFTLSASSNVIRPTSHSNLGSLSSHQTMQSQQAINASFSDDEINSPPNSFSGDSPMALLSPLSNLTNDLISMATMQQHIVNRSLPRINGGRLITDSLYYQIRQKLPTVLTHYSLNLVYSSSINGFSFNELFLACKDETPYILVIKTENSIFGAMLSDPPRPDKFPGEGEFYGKTICFVFNGVTHQSFGLQHPPNKMFMSADNNQIIIGGPSPAIALKNTLKTVESYPCETYGSPSFSSNEEGGAENILEVELYTLVAIAIAPPPTINTLDENNNNNMN